MSDVTKIRSFDSMMMHTASRKTIDTILNNVTDAELAAYMAGRAKMNPGKVWDGYLKPLLQAMDKATRDEVMGEMTNYGNELAQSKAVGETAASGLIFGGENDDEKEDEEKKDITGHKVGDGTMRGWRDQTSSAIDAMQKANDKLWKR
jgi:hypothetical protein